MAHSEILGIKDLPEMLRFEGDRLGRQMRMAWSNKDLFALCFMMFCFWGNKIPISPHSWRLDVLESFLLWQWRVKNIQYFWVLMEKYFPALDWGKAADYIVLKTVFLQERKSPTRGVSKYSLTRIHLSLILDSFILDSCWGPHSVDPHVNRYLHQDRKIQALRGDAKLLHFLLGCRLWSPCT